MPDPEWLATLATSLPRYFNTLSGRCTLVLSDCVVECSKSVLSAQSPVLQEYFMSSERDLNAVIAERRAEFLARGSVAETTRDDSGDDNDSEDDDTSIIVMTEYYGYDDIVRSFFRSFYTGEITLNPDTYHVTLKLACKYEVSWVISTCCKFLESFLSEENFFHHYRFLLGFKEDRIADVTLGKLRTLNYDKLIDQNNIDSELLRIDIEQLVLLLNNLQPPTEMHLVHLAFSWLEYDLPHRKFKFLSIISNLSLVNVPLSFTSEIIPRFAEENKVESTDLWKIVLGANTYAFTRSMGHSRRNKTQEQFPKVFETRSSYVASEEYEFKISSSDLENRTFQTEAVRLEYEPNSDKFYLRFSRKCCFVYFTNENLKSMPVLELLVYVTKICDEDEGYPYRSDEIVAFNEILGSDNKEEFVSAVAVFIT